MSRVDARTVGAVVILDALSYGLLYWVLLPVFSPWTADLPSATAMGLSHALSAVRLGLVGVLAVRSFRGRRGLQRTPEVVPSVLVGAVAAMLTQLGLGVAVRIALELSQAPVWLTVASAAEWVAFPLLGVLFVQPGPPDSVRLLSRSGSRARR